MPPLVSRLPDYIGKRMNLFQFQGKPFQYMQGGAYCLSRRAALAVASCEHGEWKHCPTRVFRDVNSKANAAIQRSPCNHSVTNAEDLLTGACLRDANLTTASKDDGASVHHPCFLTLEAGTNNHMISADGAPIAQVGGAATINATALAAAAASTPTSRKLTGHYLRCPCPITAHPLKGKIGGVPALQYARLVGKARGCWSAPPRSSNRARPD